MGGLLRQRQLLLRANQLIAADVERGIALAPELVSACNLAGRQPWLQILGADGSVTTYSLGSPPSAIWRGQVLMRCGPAYGLDGQIKAGSTPQNRVVLDGLVPSSRLMELVAHCPRQRPLKPKLRVVCWEPGQWLGAVAAADQVVSNGVPHAKGWPSAPQGVMQLLRCHWIGSLVTGTFRLLMSW